jgi:hypothetical protein
MASLKRSIVTWVRLRLRARARARVRVRVREGLLEEVFSHLG